MFTNIPKLDKEDDTMVRKSFKSLSQKVFFISILVSIFFAAGCNNGSAPAEDPKPISGKAASEGNVITVQVPENVAIVEIVRQPDNSNELSGTWFTKTNATKGSITATDYFVNAGTSYTYYASFLKSDWTEISKTQSITVKASANGKTPPSLTNTPVITYDSASTKLNFTTQPAFSNVESPLTNFAFKRFEVCYKCEDCNRYVSWTYSQGSSQSNSIGNWLNNTHSCHTLKYWCLIVKFGSDNDNPDNPKEYYSFNLGMNLSIAKIQLFNAAEVENLTINDLINKTINQDASNDSNPAHRKDIKFNPSGNSSSTQLFGKSKSQADSDYPTSDNISFVPASGSTPSKLTEDYGTSSSHTYPFYKIGNRYFLEDMTFTKTTSGGGISGTYSNNDPSHLITITIGADKAFSMTYEGQTSTGTLSNSDGVFMMTQGNNVIAKLVYKDGKFLSGRFFDESTSQ